MMRSTSEGVVARGKKGTRQNSNATSKQKTQAHVEKGPHKSEGPARPACAGACGVRVVRSVKWPV